MVPGETSDWGLLGADLLLSAAWGLFSVGADVSDVNPFGIGGIAALAGMFSKQATDKLQETFDTLFRTAPTEGDAMATRSPPPSASTT